MSSLQVGKAISLLNAKVYSDLPGCVERYWLAGPAALQPRLALLPRPVQPDGHHVLRPALPHHRLNSNSGRGSNNNEKKLINKLNVAFDVYG